MNVKNVIDNATGKYSNWHRKVCVEFRLCGQPTYNWLAGEIKAKLAAFGIGFD